jgi:hypothetical protein
MRGTDGWLSTLSRRFTCLGDTRDTGPGETTTQPRIVTGVPSLSMMYVTSESTCTLSISLPTSNLSKKLTVFYRQGSTERTEPSERASEPYRQFPDPAIYPSAAFGTTHRNE